jgi:hypothetical protein
MTLPPPSAETPCYHPRLGIPLKAMLQSSAETGRLVI